MRTRVAPVLALCWMAACGGGGDNPDPQGKTAEVNESGATMGEQNPQQASPSITPITRPEQTMAAGRLSPVNNSGVTGSVNVRGIGEQTEISLNVTGTTGSSQVHGAVVQGTCENSGAEVAPVGPIPVGAGNIATLTDTLPLPPGTVLNGQHALVIKGENAGPATPPLACSPLPRWERLPPTG
jgi:hypothetical protein